MWLFSPEYTFKISFLKETYHPSMVEGNSSGSPFIPIPHPVGEQSCHTNTCLCKQWHNLVQSDTAHRPGAPGALCVRAATLRWNCCQHSPAQRPPPLLLSSPDHSASGFGNLVHTPSFPLLWETPFYAHTFATFGSAATVVSYFLPGLLCLNVSLYTFLFFFYFLTMWQKKGSPALRKPKG